jgi:hypothetical protein
MTPLCLLLLSAALSAAPAASSASSPVRPPPATPTPAAAPAPAPMSLLSDLGMPGEEGANGEWAEYAILSDGKPQLTETMRVLAVVDPMDGGAWFELWLDKTGRNALRAREGFGTLIKMGSAVMEMPREPEPRSEQVCSAGGACRPPSSTEVEQARADPNSLKLFPCRVVAGRFKCQKLVRGSGQNQVQVWKSDDVPVFNLVRALYPGGNGFELVAHGRNGRTAFPARFTPTAFPFAKLKNLERLLPLNPNGLPGGGEPQPSAKQPAPAPAPPPAIQQFDPNRAIKR